MASPNEGHFPGAYSSVGPYASRCVWQFAMADMGPPALTAAVHLIRVLVNRGLLSPNEVENIYNATIETIPAEEADYVRDQFDPIFVEIRDEAQKQWAGHDDPERLT